MATFDDLRYTTFPLNTGSGAIPAMGFGTLIPNLTDTRNAVKVALETGFRALDCSERYRNEQAVGEALQEVLGSGKVKRSELFVASKLWNNHHRPEYVRPAFEASLARLQLDYLDLYLVHTPFAFKPGDEQDPRDASGKVIYDTGVTLPDTWRAMERLVEQTQGRCRAIGLSDVSTKQLDEVLVSAKIVPAVVHVESHPYLPQWDCLSYCRDHGIVMQAFAPLGHSIQPRLLDDLVIVDIARQVGKTPAQVLLAWAVQRGTALLTSSTSPGRIQENFDISTLPDDAMQAIKERIQTRVRYNPVTETGVPGFIPGRR